MVVVGEGEEYVEMRIESVLVLALVSFVGRVGFYYAVSVVLYCGYPGVGGGIWVLNANLAVFYGVDSRVNAGSASVRCG